MSLPRRLTRPVLCLAAALGVLVSLPAASGAVALGVTDNNWGMFYQPDFTALHTTETRIGVPWDLVTRRADRSLVSNLAAWLDGARTDHITPLVTFGADGGTAGNHIPTIPEYRRAIKAFLRRFPSVRRLAAWNEPDWPYRPGIARHPALAAAYFNNLVSLCHCQVIAGEFFLPANQLGSWLRSYKRYLHHTPAGWALHDYTDIRTHSTAQLRTLLRYTTGPVYLDEVAGVERRGHWPYPNQGTEAAASDERFMLSLAKFRRVTHIYHYEWQGNPLHGWDSGLIAPDGSRRPAYRVWLSYTRALRGRK